MWEMIFNAAHPFDFLLAQLVTARGVGERAGGNEA